MTRNQALPEKEKHLIDMHKYLPWKFLPETNVIQKHLSLTLDNPTKPTKEHTNIGHLRHHTMDHAKPLNSHNYI